MSLAKITIVGAGNVGATAAHILLGMNLADIYMVDVAPGVAEGKALDMMHMRGNDGFSAKVYGSVDYAMTAESDIVIVTAGVPRKPGMTREDLLSVNAGIVRSVLDGALPASPNAIYLFVTNPLDVMVNYGFELAKLPANRLFGMGGVLDTARFVHAISSRFDCEPTDVEAMVIGAHGEAMLPLPRLAKVAGKPITEVLSTEEIDAVVAETINGGAAIVELLQTGSAFYAPGASIATMVSEILRPTGRVLVVSARLSGQYGISGVHLGVPVRLGPEGIAELVELELLDDELRALRDAAESIQAQLTLVT